jgi:glucose/arabinose dehydrogenase
MAVRAGDPTLYVAEKVGRVRAIRGDGVDPRPVLDLSGQISLGGEQGLLGLAFSPDGRFLYVNYTDPAGDTHVTEFAMGNRSVDLASRRDVLFVDQPFSNHNGGNLVFGPDGYLYLGLGDGGSAGDPLGNAQSLGTLLGKMLRIDPRPGGGRPYRIPEDNPFVDREGARPEIWAYGLRNPWRYSFDRNTGDLWIGDVGQSAREEIDLQAAQSAGGENYGWDRLEGTLRFEGSAPPNAVPPVFEYGRDQGGTVIGGYVYRGRDIPGLNGTYLFGDLFNPGLSARA